VDDDAAPHGAVRADRVGLLGVLDPEALSIGLCRVKVHAERPEYHGAAGKLEKIASRYSHRTLLLFLEIFET
jgi:hypothetical protein